MEEVGEEGELGDDMTCIWELIALHVIWETGYPVLNVL
jgi:hypothetical protein